MANYIVSDTDLTSVANAIRTKGGTSDQLSFPTGFNTAIANISAGDLPVTAGSFTTQSTEGVQTVSIPYNGNGYPISLQIVIDGGAWGKSSFTRGEIQVLSITKDKPNVVPLYNGTTSTNGGLRSAVYAKDTLGSKSYMYGDSSMYTQTNPSETSPIHIKAKNTITVYVAPSLSTNCFFLANQKYNYVVVYNE